MTEYILKGRSIDGTVYRTEFGWSTVMKDALCMDAEKAKEASLEQFERNRKANLDNIIGHLHVIEVPEFLLKHRARLNYLVMDSSIDELAVWLLETMNTSDLDKLDEQIKANEEIEEKTGDHYQT